jgi:hypothetical protein
MGCAVIIHVTGTIPIKTSTCLPEMMAGFVTVYSDAIELHSLIVMNRL